MLCYMVPPAPDSNFQPRKMAKNTRLSVPPSLPLCSPWYLTDSAHICYSYCSFCKILQQFEILYWPFSDSYWELLAAILDFDTFIEEQDI